MAYNMDYLQERNKKTYAERAAQTTNEIAKKLLTLMDEKQTNLCFADDETDPDRMLEQADSAGPDIAVLKTHIDAVEDFTPKITQQLQALSKKHDFLIFEDRKFADIGNTVKLQYGKGIYKIAAWSDITNAHIVPGPGVIEGLKTVAVKAGKPRGLILLAQMSSKGNLATDEYTKKAVAMAEQYPDFVFGFIGNGGNVEELRKLVALAEPSFVIMAPGVQLGGGGDALKQQYTTPADVIAAGADVIIVGRGIYGAPDPLEAAKQYRAAGWNAYQKRSSKTQPRLSLRARP
ncbi:MAG: orotidine-5'-phosphate decarboxylase [Patescibacteria group bacterium]